MDQLGENDVERKAIKMTAKLVSDIIKKRKELELTQSEVAEKAGLTQSQVARLENSSQIPRLDTLIKVAISLGLNISLSNIEEEAATYAVAH